MIAEKKIKVKEKNKMEHMDQNLAVQNAPEESSLNKSITTGFLLKFTMPTILSYVLMSVFGIIDGLFAQRAVGPSALTAVGLVAPFFMLTMSMGAMLSMGGSALVAKMKGERDNQSARQIFTLLSIITLVTSAILSGAGLFITDPILRLLGTSYEMLPIAREYMVMITYFIPAIMLGMFLVQFLIVEGKPGLSATISLLGTLTNTALNWFFLFRLDMGARGLALATGIGYTVPALVGVLYFTFFRKGSLFFTKPKWDLGAIGISSLNGASEMVTMMATTLTTIVMNNVLVRMDGVGDLGVAVATMVMAFVPIFGALFMGYSAGVGPLISYNYGKQNHKRTRKLFLKSMVIVSVLALFATALTVGFADWLIRIYVSPGEYITGYYPGFGYFQEYIGFMHGMAVRGLRFAALGFLFMGVNTFASAMFTALNNGIVSGFLSLMRTLVLALPLLILLPMQWDLNGVWLALPLAEVLSIAVSAFFLLKMAKRYGYSKAGAKEDMVTKLSRHRITG